MSNHAGNNSATTSNDYGKECSVAGPSGEQQNVKKRKSEDLKKNFSTTPAKKVRQMTDRMTGAKKGATMKKETRKVTIQPKIVEISASEEEEEGDVTDMENQPECVMYLYNLMHMYPGGAQARTQA
nr:PREDICTED: uncharacterized protein LOC109032010 [Bemisia tabaci]